MDLGDIVVCKTIVNPNNSDNLDWEWHYYGPESTGNQHYGPDWVKDELLKENPRDPSTYVSIPGWSGTTEDREELHRRFSERSYNREWNEWKDNHHEVDEDHHKWVANQESSQYQPWEYGHRVGDPDPGNVEITDDMDDNTKRYYEDKHKFYTGTPKTTGYPSGYEGDANVYPFHCTNESAWLQGWRSRTHFNDMYGMEPEDYVAQHYGDWTPVRPEWVDYVDPADATVPE
jgi:ribosome modulation factor